MAMTRDMAAKCALYAQGGLVVAGAAIVGALTLPMPAPAPLPEADDSGFTAPAPTSAGGSEDAGGRGFPEPAEWAQLGAMLSSLRDPIVEEVEQVVEAPIVPEPPDRPGKAEKDLTRAKLSTWKYLGHFNVGEEIMALVSIRESQRIMREGEEYNVFTLGEITPEAMEVREGEVVVQLERVAVEPVQIGGAPAGRPVRNAPGRGRPDPTIQTIDRGAPDPFEGRDGGSRG